MEPWQAEEIVCALPQCAHKLRLWDARQCVPGEDYGGHTYGAGVDDPIGADLACYTRTLALLVDTMDHLLQDIEARCKARG